MTVALRERTSVQRERAFPGAFIRDGELAQEKLIERLRTMRILAVDNQPFTLRAIHEEFEKYGLGLNLVLEEHPIRALELLADEHFDANILDLEMPEMTGEEFLRAAGERGIFVPTVVFSGSWGNSQLAHLTDQIDGITTQRQLERFAQEARIQTNGNPLLYVHKGVEGMRRLPKAAAVVGLVGEEANEQFNETLGAILPKRPEYPEGAMSKEQKQELRQCLDEILELMRLFEIECTNMIEEIERFEFIGDGKEGMGGYYEILLQMIDSVDRSILLSQNLEGAEAYDARRGVIHEAYGTMNICLHDNKEHEEMIERVAEQVVEHQREEFKEWYSDRMRHFHELYSAIINAAIVHNAIVDRNTKINNIYVAVLAKYSIHAKIINEYAGVEDLRALLNKLSLAVIPFEQFNPVYDMLDLCMGNAVKAIEGRERVVAITRDLAAFEELPERARESISSNTAAETRSEHFWIVSVRDEGIGMTPEELQAVRNPVEGRTTFWEEKGMPAGTGFGLSRVDSIAREIKGFWEINSEGIGRGAEVKLYIPVIVPPPKEINNVPEEQ